MTQAVVAQGLYQAFLDGKASPTRYQRTRHVEHHEPAELRDWRLLVGKLLLAMNEERTEWPHHQQVRPRHFAQAIRSDLHRHDVHWKFYFERMYQPARGYPDPVAPALITDSLEPVLARLLQMEYGDVVPGDDDPLFLSPASNGIKIVASVGQIERAVEAARALGARLDEEVQRVVGGGS